MSEFDSVLSGTTIEMIVMSILPIGQDAGEQAMSHGNRTENAALYVPDVPAHQVQMAMDSLRSEQNMMAGAVSGTVAAFAGAGFWALVTVVTEYQIGWMAVGVGFHHCHDSATVTSGAPAEPRVLTKSVAIDLGPAAKFRGVRHFHHSVSVSVSWSLVKSPSRNRHTCKLR